MIEYCLKKAQELPMTHRQRLYAVVTDRKGNILGEGANSFVKSHPAQAKAAKKVGQPFKECLHAESLALIRAAKTGKIPYQLTVARILRDNVSSGLAMPCAVCSFMAKEAGVEVISFST